MQTPSLSCFQISGSGENPADEVNVAIEHRVNVGAAIVVARLESTGAPGEEGKGRGEESRS
jgi:hypothetical protein